MTPAEMCNPCVRYDVTHVPGLYTHKGRGGEKHAPANEVNTASFPQLQHPHKL